jgi:hypothetical protein
MPSPRLKILPLWLEPGSARVLDDSTDEISLAQKDLSVLVGM